MTTTDVHTLSGAYALDALDDSEVSEFRRHLAGCQGCRDEVRELREVAARMGAIEFQQPPAQLRSRVLAAADRTPQLPPLVEAVRQPAAFTGSGTGQDGVSGAGAAPGRSASWARRNLTRLAVAAAAVVLVGAGGLGVRQFTGSPEQPGLSVAAARVFQADDALTATARTTTGGALVVAVSPSRHQVAVDTRQLPELDQDLAYQLWQLRDGEAISAAVFGEDKVSAAIAMLGDGTEIALTVEPEGGSQLPTMEPIVVVNPAKVVRTGLKGV